MEVGARRRVYRIFGVSILLIGLFTLGILGTSSPVHAASGINPKLNFQGRLYTSSGATVPDGYYNLQFKIYQDGDGLSANDSTGSPSGSLKWTESWLNVNGKGVQIKNGFMSVDLGSVTAFGSSIDWNQDTLWLSLNIGSTNGSCASFAVCTPDGEMLPMKRLSSTPYSLNSGQLGGLTSGQFVQLAQGVQTEAGNSTNSISLNKTGTGGNFINLQSAGTNVFTVTNTGELTFGGDANHSISINTASSGSAGGVLNVVAGSGGAGSGSAGGALVLQGGSAGGTNGNGGNVAIDSGAKTGSGSEGLIAIGTARASTIYLGTATLAATQNILIGANSTAGSTTNVTLGNGSGATSGTTTLQAKTALTINTNGIARASFDNAGSVYFGNGVSATAPSNFTISGTSSTATAVAGGTLSVQGGNATTGNANGGNISLSGGSGVGSGASGLVVLSTPTFSTTANDPNCYTSGSLVASSCTIAVNSVNNSSAILAGFNTDGKTATLPDPTQLTAGRVVYVTAANGSNDFTLIVNGGGLGNQIAMRQNTTATMLWNGADWTAAGASSSTTLQSAYDNTLQSAGGAELVVSKTNSTNGLTIRDSVGANAVNGTLLSVQTGSASTLLSVNSNVTEYASNSGGETAGGTSATFPSNTWSALSGTTTSRYNTAGNYIATGQASVASTTTATANTGVKNQLVNSSGAATALNANTTYNVSFTTRLLSGTFTDMNVYYSVNGSIASVVCASTATSLTSVWNKVNCTFTTPASGISSSNAILIRQTAASARTFYVDNLSVTIAADYNFASDSSVSDSGNFSTNWTYSTGIGAGSVTRNTSDGNDASDSAQVTISTGAANAGVRNKLGSNPLPSTLYRMTVYAKLSSGTFTDFKMRYSRNNGANYTDCVDYSTQTVTTSAWTKITCYMTTDAIAPTSPYVYFAEGSSSARTFMVDSFSMTLQTATTPNVQVGGGVNGGPTTLFTLDKGASAPIASDNDALLGSMYYDTTLGKLQCYEADGWGACGSSPDNVVTISPEYTNAVMHGTGVGTMTSDLCSDTLNINDGSSGQSTICGTNETFNYYKWTSPQATAQTYGIYVTYQLPGTFKSFSSGQTSLMGRTDSGNATVNYQIYRSDATGLTSCGSSVAVSTGVQTSWQTGVASGSADPSTCNFAPGNSIVFKINVTASSNASAYVGNLNFIYSNR
jgi:trimeric autotransporter adhesin